MKRIAAVLVALAGAVFAVNGYRPFSKRGYGAGYAFGYGLLASELPLYGLAAHVAALAAVTPRRSPRTTVFSWTVAVASWVALLGLRRAGHNAQETLTAALDEGLGQDRRTDGADLWKRPASGGATAKKPGPARMLRIWRDYAHDADISYGEFGSRNHLDIWRRPDLDRDGRAPVLLQVHGGAWMVGNKRGQAHPLMSHLAELGWICVSVNYRLSPRSTWPDQIVDVKRAIAWTKENIASYGGDPEWIAITGGSAGGHLSSLAALTPNDPLFQTGFEDADTRVQAAVPFYGFYDFTRDDAVHPMMPAMLGKRVFKLSRGEIAEPFRLASPITHVSEDAPPFFVLHGTNDSLIPVEQARSFTSRLREVSRQPVVYAELPWAQHAFDIFGSARAAHTAVAVEQFLAEVYASSRADRRATVAS
ncbi:MULTISPECIES: alpha/beta hydrolase [Mycobacterium]|uniref:Esterase n=1 Tax=Mycobacterium kiyosense TaxID=2871094 RepID=A0A9P3Q631_9MYCO|nr:MULTISPECIES: alpha/beta hydrolase [Mycobacterium]BDB44442.1 esterase [Mycobacterium kiyosense]BDE15958.1 esterase [Mycobacterium sp. 20KCMC460]GLB81792.1 esterase [Mycobacterium kiyosense]GLB90344.1 esterase [Mycobacterium kiyosense]GLB96067.1 esterase [Mycobacterium kiyosense]